MKITAILAMTAMAGITASARQQTSTSTSSRVTVYVANEAAQPAVLHDAKAMAAGMFSRAGVRIEWRDHRQAASALSPGAISISFATQTPGSFMPGALAYARPYEGVHITVFYDRIERIAPRSAKSAAVLAHVLVHEITHVLQGVDRHSESGVMKADWTGQDYAQMATRPLPFTVHDVVLIQRGLRVRETRLAAAE